MSDDENDFICSITLDTMEEPVTTSCGHTFENEALRRHLTGNGKCPLCRKTIENKEYSTNTTLKSIIQRKKRKKSSDEQTDLKKHKPDYLHNFLESIGMSQHYIILKEKGYDKPLTLPLLTGDELVEMIGKPGHVKVIMAKIDQIKNPRVQELLEGAKSGLTKLHNSGKYTDKDFEKAFAIWETQKTPDAWYAKGWYHSTIDKKLNMVVPCYEEAAEMGHFVAQSNLAHIYKNRGNLEKAFHLFKKSAESGFDTAQFELGNCYSNGNGVEKDNDKAFEWFEKAAKQGNDRAQDHLGDCFNNGNGTGMDKEKAVEWWKKAAEQGNAQAQNNVGDYYYHNHDNYKEAVKWYQKAADQQYNVALYNLGWCYLYGKGVEKDTLKGLMLIGSAACDGYSDAQYKLGLLSKKGEFIQRDQKSAFKWFQKAANQNHLKAMVRLGNCYFYGHGVQMDYKKAFDWYTKAADKENPTGQFNLGDMYAKGHGCQKDFQKAVKYWKLADDKGDGRAHRELAKIAEKWKAYQQLNDKNSRLAWEHLEWSACYGNPASQYELGIKYKGKGDYKQAIHYFGLASDQGMQQAMNEMGICYREQKDYEKAHDCFAKCAETGFSCAQYNLALMYELGEGRDVDLQKAFDMYQKSAGNGNSGAQQKLKEYRFRFYVLVQKADNGDKESQYQLGMKYRDKGDYKQAIHYFGLASEQGMANAKFKLGYLHYQQKNYEKAFGYYKQCAENNRMPFHSSFVGYDVGYVQYELALMYEQGHGTCQDLKKALFWYISSAGNGYHSAQQKLKEDKFIILILKQKADNGDKESQYQLGMKYRYKNDFKQAIHYFDLAHKQGMEKALNEIALSHCDGPLKDYQKAFSLYKQSDEKNDPHSQFCLGLLCEYGKGCEMDQEKAIGWYQKSASNGNKKADKWLGRLKIINELKPKADNGDLEAQYQLGIEHVYRLRFGLVTDLRKHEYDMALHYFNLTIKAGHRPKDAAFNTAMIYNRYFNPNGLNNVIAFDHIKKSENDFHIGQYYEQGIGCPMDLTLAYEHYKNAQQKPQLKKDHEWLNKKISEQKFKYIVLTDKADNGDINAQLELGKHYETPSSKDIGKSIYYYKMAADKGNFEARYKLSRIYQNENGYKNKKDAFHYLQLCADEEFQSWQKYGYKHNTFYNVDWPYKYGICCNGVASCYKNGRGTGKDLKKALEYYQKSFDLGYKRARKMVEKCKKELNIS